MKSMLFMGLGGPELIFIILIIMLLFGGKKIPELMKGMGKGVKSFKDGMNGVESASDAPAKNENTLKQEPEEE